MIFKKYFFKKRYIKKLHYKIWEKRIEMELNKDGLEILEEEIKKNEQNIDYARKDLAKLSIHGREDREKRKEFEGNIKQSEQNIKVIEQNKNALLKEVKSLLNIISGLEHRILFTREFKL